MNDPKKQTYVHYYNASAMALGGRITRPFDAVIETQAATVLPITGGFGTAHAEDFQFREIISFKRAHSVVTGSQSERDGAFATLASVTIEDLNILDVVTAKRITAHIATNHPVLPIEKGQEPRPSPPPQIVAAGGFEGLHVNGYELDVEFDTTLSCDCDTYAAYRERCGVEEQKGLIVRSLVKSIFKKSPGATVALRTRAAAAEVPENLPCAELNPALPSAQNRFGCWLELPQVGRLHLLQFLCSPYARRLVMLRVELGCPVGGSAASGIVEGNGSTVP